MGRIMGIDYGLKRVGLAVTDSLKLIATPLGMVENAKLIDFLKKYLSEEPVEAFVIGMPKRLDNTDTHATPHVKGFAKKLKTLFPDCPIYWVDERFTSKIALASMIESGTKKKDRKDKGNIDTISATIILQTYMEKIR